MKSFFRTSWLSRSLVAGLLALLAFTIGCNKGASDLADETAALDASDPDLVEVDQETIRARPTSEVIEDAPILPRTVTAEAHEVELPYADDSLFRHFTIRTFSDFDPDNLAKGGWEFNGPFIEYWPNQQPLSQGNYADNQMTGDWTWWYEDGTMSKQATYENGAVTGEVKVWRPDSTLERVESYLAGKKDGRWITYEADGVTPEAQYEYKDGVPHGVAILWYPGGLQMKEETHFLNGQLHGKRTNWYLDGQIAIEENYQEGKPHGRFTHRSPTGTLLNDQQYESGRRVPSQG